MRRNPSTHLPRHRSVWACKPKMTCKSMTCSYQRLIRSIKIQFKFRPLNQIGFIGNKTRQSRKETRLRLVLSTFLSLPSHFVFLHLFYIFTVPFGWLWCETIEVKKVKCSFLLSNWDHEQPLFSSVRPEAFRLCAAIFYLARFLSLHARLCNTNVGATRGPQWWACLCILRDWKTLCCSAINFEMSNWERRINYTLGIERKETCRVKKNWWDLPPLTVTDSLRPKFLYFRSIPY